PYTGGGLEPATLLAPPSDTWPTYHGDYSGRHHSKLSTITPQNVNQLTLAWTFQTGTSEGIKSAPIVVNGIAYVTAPDHMWAVDAEGLRSGDGQGTVGVLQHAAAGHARIPERRRDRRTDVDDRHLRSRAQPRLRRHRRSDAGPERTRASRRQQVDRQHPRDQS